MKNIKEKMKKILACILSGFIVAASMPVYVVNSEAEGDGNDNEKSNLSVTVISTGRKNKDYEVGGVKVTVNVECSYQVKVPDNSGISGKQSAAATTAVSEQQPAVTTTAVSDQQPVVTTTEDLNKEPVVTTTTVTEQNPETTTTTTDSQKKFTTETEKKEFTAVTDDKGVACFDKSIETFIIECREHCEKSLVESFKIVAKVENCTKDGYQGFEPEEEITELQYDEESVIDKCNLGVKLKENVIKNIKINYDKNYNYNEKVYDGKSYKFPTIDGVQDGDDVIYYITKDKEEEKAVKNPAIINAGSYRYHFVVKREGCVDYVSDGFNFTIIPSEIVEGINLKDLYFTNEEQQLFDPDDIKWKEIADNSEFKIEYSTDGGTTFSENIPTRKAVGNYDIEVKITEIKPSGNYNEFNRTFNVVINKMPVIAHWKKQKLEIIFNEKNSYDIKNEFAYFEDINGDPITNFADDDRVKYILNGYNMSIDDKNGVLKYFDAAQGTVGIKFDDNSSYELKEQTPLNVLVKYLPVKDTCGIKKLSGNKFNNIYWNKSEVTISPKDSNYKIFDCSSDAAGNDILKSDKWKSSLKKTRAGIYDNVKVRLKNQNGEISEPISVNSFGIDKYIPKTSNVHFSFISEKANNLKYGYFAGNVVNVSVRVNDANGHISSSVKEIQLIEYQNGNGKVVRKYYPKNEFCSFSYKIEKEFSGKIQLKITDYAGNVSYVNANSLNSNVIDKNGFLVFENNSPVISLSGNERENRNLKKITQDGKTIYNGNFVIGYKVSDKDSGINRVILNGEKQNFSSFEKSAQGKISNRNIKASEDGKYRLTVTAVDNSGNIAEKSIEFYKDSYAPRITGFGFNTDKGEKLDGEKQTADYGFYFKNNVSVTISADDKYDKSDKSDKNEYSCGVKEITYKAVDINGNVVYKGTKKVDEENKITFKIDKNFKGQIYAYAVDNIGNKGSFVTVYSMVAENSTKHGLTSRIEIKLPKTSHTQENSYSYSYSGKGQRDFQPENNKASDVPLYNKDVTAKIRVADTFSGIRKVRCIVQSKNGNVLNSSEITAENKGIKSKTGKWTFVTDRNIVTEIEGKINISANENDITVLVELTDNAGNVSYDFYTLGIDKTVPVINISFRDKAKNDKKYFNKTRTAQITVKARNFEPDGVKVSVKNSMGNTGELSQWTKAVDNSGENIYKAALTLADEGDYTLSARVIDKAGNKSQSTNEYSFTIDKTKPLVSMEYDNNNVKNKMYFDSSRKAEIKVSEHNFDESKVKINVAAEDNGRKISVPVSQWNSDGDIHKCTLDFTKDGVYKVSVVVRDKAENKNNGIANENSAAIYNFIIDKKIDGCTIDGVENKRSYKDNVSPEIDFTDTNYSHYKIKITRSNLTDKDEDVTEKFKYASTSGSSGVSVKFENIPKEKDNDGIYTLTFEGWDKSGNKVNKRVIFSVNRFGSVYVFGDYFTTLKGAYLRKLNEDLSIEEYNPDKLQSNSVNIDITCDGKSCGSIEDCKVESSEDGWYKYVYTIPKEIFEKDGVYKVALSSKDNAGNKSFSDAKNGEIIFSVDNTPPEIASVVGLEKSIYNAQWVDVTLDAFDAIGLKDARVYVDGNIVDLKENIKDLNHSEGTFKINEGVKQKIRIVLEDYAGNILDTSETQTPCEFEKEVTVTTNGFVRWYSDKKLFVISLVGIGTIIALTGVLIALVVRRKKKSRKIW